MWYLTIDVFKSFTIMAKLKNFSQIFSDYKKIAIIRKVFSHANWQFKNARKNRSLVAGLNT